MAEYYYGGIEDEGYAPIRWHNADSLEDAVFKAKAYLSKNKGRYSEIEIQTRPIDPPLSPKIPQYRIGCVIKTREGYVYCHYTAKSFNAKEFGKDYMIKGKSLIPIKK